MGNNDITELVEMVAAISKETNDTRGTILALTAMITAIAQKQGLHEKEVQDLVISMGDPGSMVQNDVRNRAARTVSELFRIADITN